MKFKLNGDGVLTYVEENKNKRNIIDFDNINCTINKTSLKKTSFLDNRILSVSVTGAYVIGTATANAMGAGIFWEAFQSYIFPYILDIGKVFCAIKISQAFYMENRGGKESGTGFQAFVQYGKWYLLMVLIPFFVQLIDELGVKMLSELKKGG